MLAHDSLLAMVKNQELEFDKIYSETKIVRDFAISRTPMRDALNRISSERYIDILHGRGFRLHKSTRADVYEAYHVRCAIERYCARILTSDSHSERAKQYIQRMQKLTHAQAWMSSQSEIELRVYWNCDMEFNNECMVDYVNVTAVQ